MRDIRVFTTRFVTLDPVWVKYMRTLLITFLCLAAFQAPLAAEAPKDDQGVDAPSRVARLAYKEGQVEMAPAGTEEWTEALLNRPLTTDDRLWVGGGGKAELQLGSAAIYLDEDSGFSFLDLDDDLMHMSLTDGAATIRVRRKSDNESIEIETPNATITLLRPGEYHIEIAEDGAATVVDTRTGESEVAGEKDSYTVRTNERGVFRGTDELSADIKPLGPRTSFQNWANERERREESASSSRYVSRDVIGYEDLDDNGEWVSDPEYGYVWTPTYVDAGWAPYRFGRWVWVSPWGWTWVDNYRWGFAPFHYGRWAYARDRWCWVPGPRHHRPVYAPALVGWVGGGGVGISVSIGSGVGWFPLGPREVYVPGYWHSRRYIHSVNVSNTYIVNNAYIDNFYNGRDRYDYRYGRLPRAVTLVPRDRFVGGRPLEGYVNVREDDLRRWHHDARPPAIAPERSSVLAGRVVSHRPTLRPLIRPQQLDADRGNSAFLARRTAPTRVSFDAERRAIEANNGRPVDRTRIISNNPRAVAREREDFRNEWAQRGSSDSARRDDGRNARTQPAPSALQSSRENPSAQRSGPVKNFGTERTLSDRPAWARERSETERSHEAQQSESRTVKIPVRPRDEGRDRARQEERNAPAQQSGSASTATTGFNELRREVTQPGGRSRAQGSNDPTADKERRLESQPRDSERSAFSEQSRPQRQTDRTPAAQHTPPVREQQRQTSQPRETSQPSVREQPALREQSRPERSYQQRSEPAQERSEPAREQSRPERSIPQRSEPRQPSQSEGRSSSHDSSQSGSEGRSSRSLDSSR